MLNKLISLDQMALLKAGDVLYRCLSHAVHGTNLLERDRQGIDVFRIKSINQGDGTIKLEAAEETLEVFTWPEDRERLNLDTSYMLSEGIWWQLE